uniref:Uncharacterized protein n=1 Tax=Lepeophtheirus salmonis TaxID=72036 RepID=A0A0K2VH87_LEPSM
MDLRTNISILLGKSSDFHFVMIQDVSQEEAIVCCKTHR